MKKILNIFGVSVLALTVLVGCGGDSNSSSFDGEILVVSREDGSGTRGAFVELLDVEVDGNDMTYDEAVIANSTGVVITNVQSDDYAIGYISLGSLNNDIKALTVDGVTATVDNVLEGSYEISRPFNLATKGDRSILVQDFIDFILSIEGQEIVADSFVPIAGGDVYETTNLSGTITIGGSTSVAPLMEKLKEAYEELNPDVTIEIQALGSSAGMTGAIDGTFDIGMASRSLKDSEMGELDHLAICLDAIAVVVNNNNPTNDLSQEEIRQIFTGESTDWADFNLYEE